MLLLFSMGAISWLYMLCSFALLNGIRLRNAFKKDSYEGISVWAIIGAAGAGFSLSAVSIGVLFKIMRWPGADINIYTGLTFSAIILLTALVRIAMKKTFAYKGIVIRAFSWIAVGAFFASISYRDIDKFIYRDNPAFVKVCEELEKDPYNDSLLKVYEIELMRNHMSEEEIKYHLEHSELIEKRNR